METYDVTGRLVSIRNRVGQTQTLSYNTDGLLNSVTDMAGRQLLFTYEPGVYRIASVTVASGEIYHYTHDNAGRLSSVTYPDGKTRTYLYNESANTSGANVPYALTGIIDENGNRYATYKYNSTGKAISSEHAGGAEKVTLTYNTNGTTTVTDALGTARTYSFQTIPGVVKNAGISQPCASCGGGSQSMTYDANGNISSKTDFNGSKTCYAYDLARNLKTVRVEGFTSGTTCPANLASYTLAAGTPQRKITTQWHPTYRVPQTIAEPKRLTHYVYHGDGGVTCGATGALCEKTLEATTDANGEGLNANVTGTPRTWTYTYNAMGQVLTADGPRTDVTDVTTYTYYTANDRTVSTT